MAAKPKARFWHLPTQPERRGDYLYAAEFSNGVIKVGATRNPRLRAGSLEQETKKRITRFACFRTSNSLFEAESALIGRVAKVCNRHRGREFFCGIRFGDASNMVRQFALRFLASEEQVA